MDQEAIDWILSQPRATLDKYRAMVNNEYRPAYAKWGKQMGNPAWMHVLQGLGDKLNDCYGRAQRMGFDFDLSLKDLADMYLNQEGKCAVTGLIMNFESGSVTFRNPYRCSVDRTNSQKGYTRSNCRLTLHWANNAYNTWDDKLFETMIRASYARLTS